MGTMIERVARAIYSRDGWVYGTEDRMFEPYPFGELDEIQTAYFMERARAAIEEMREPNETMVEAPGCSDLPILAEGSSAYLTWQAMIDAALDGEGK